jgi:hypothetical protein
MFTSIYTAQASQLDKLIKDVEKCVASVKNEVQKHPEMGEKIDQIIHVVKEETKDALTKTGPLLQPLDKEKFTEQQKAIIADIEKDANVLLEETKKLFSFHQKQIAILVENNFDKNNFNTAVAIFEKASDTIANAITASHIESDFKKMIASLKPAFPNDIIVDLKTEEDADGNEIFCDFHCQVK